MVGNAKGKGAPMRWQYYTHKQTVIRAIRWSESQAVLPGMIRRDNFTDRKNKSVLPRFEMSWDQCAALIEGQQGWHMVKNGDFICRGAAGELFPVPPEIFEANYELDEGQPRQPLDDKMQAGINDTVTSAINKASGNV